MSVNCIDTFELNLYIFVATTFLQVDGEDVVVEDVEVGVVVLDVRIIGSNLWNVLVVLTKTDWQHSVFLCYKVKGLRSLRISCATQ